MMPRDNDKRFLGLWPTGKPTSTAGAGTFSAKAGAAPKASTDDGGDPEYVTKDMLDEAVGAMDQKITGALDEIKSMLTNDEDPSAEGDDEDPEASGDEDEPTAATAEELARALPNAPEAFRASCVAGGLTLDQATKQYNAAGRHEAVTTIGRQTPAAPRRRGARPAAKGTAGGFRASVEQLAAKFMAEDGDTPDRAQGRAVSRLAAQDPEGYNKFQIELDQAHIRQRIGA